MRYVRFPPLLGRRLSRGSSWAPEMIQSGISPPASRIVQRRDRRIEIRVPSRIGHSFVPDPRQRIPHACPNGLQIQRIVAQPVHQATLGLTQIVVGHAHEKMVRSMVTQAYRSP